MAEQKEIEAMVSDEGKNVCLVLKGCTIEGDNNVIHICPCCKCAGSGGSGDGNGNGNGNGGDGNGNGNGGDGNGNGNGDGGNGDGGNGDGNGGNDDDKPGDAIISLLGGTASDQFSDILPTSEGYAVYGKTSSYGGTDVPLLAFYDTDLKLLSQTVYKGGIWSNRFNRMADGSAYLLLGEYKSTYYHHTLIQADPESREVLSARCIQSNSGNQSTISVLALTPEDFTGSAKMITTGLFQNNYSFIYAFDKDSNLLVGRNVKFGSNTLALRDIATSRDSILAAGYGTNLVTSGLTAGVLVEFDDVLGYRKAVAIGYEKSLWFTCVRKTENGYLVAGQITDKSTAKGNILLLELDSEYAIQKRVMIHGSGDDAVTSIDVDASGNILLCGLTTSAGAGGTDVMLIRVNAEFDLTKEMVFGTVSGEISPRAIFNADGSVTVVGGTAGAGAGGNDAFIATMKGNWTELTGSLAKYPAIRINARPGFQVEKEFTLQVNDSTTITAETSAPAEVAVNFVADTNSSLIVDPNAVAEA